MMLKIIEGFDGVCCDIFFNYFLFIFYFCIYNFYKFITFVIFASNEYRYNEEVFFEF